jgi:hypothetical protein
MFLHSATLHGYVYKRDFSSVYVGARAIAEGRGGHLYDLEAQRELMDAAILPYHRYNLLPYIYPAYVAVLLSPLGRLSLDEAFLVWTGINLLAAAWLIAELTRSFSKLRPQRAATLVAVLAWVPLQLTLGHGQLGMLCALGVTKAVLSLRKGNRWQAGGWLALGLMKPQILILPLCALLLWRCWRTLATFTGAALLVAGISFAKAGFWIGEYLRFIADFNGKGAGVSLYPTAMQNWRGLVASLLRSDTSTAAHFSLAALTIGTIGMVFLVCRGQRGHSLGVRSAALPANWERRFAVVIVAGIMASPYLYAHDWVIALPALVILFQPRADESSQSNDRRGRLSATLLWLIALSPFVCFASQFDLSSAKSAIPLVPLYMGLLMVVAAIVETRTESAQ